MSPETRDIFEPSDDRLAAIKSAGRQRHTRRQVRLATLGGLAAVLLVAVPLVTSSLSEREGEGPVAARQDDGCRDSTRLECGPFRWDPQPAANQPLQADIRAAAEGEQVTVSVRWQDSDAPRAEAPLICWDDPCGAPPEPCVDPLATGAWTPPPPAPGAGELRFPHTYSEAGAHRVTVAVRSHAWPDRSCPPGSGDPYSDTVVLTTTVTTGGT